MGEIRYIIIAKRCEVAGKSSKLDGCLKKSFSSVYDLGKQFFGHPSCIDDFPCNLTQFCYIMVEVNDVTDLCNTVYSFFLRQIYWHIPVKMELCSSIVVSPCRLQ